ncbi:hypothetical protein [Hydrogenimonas cancrithermarum]|uniref:Uncharacterized protein n=1 Tax=Hydrogenimonas cancrithermarum TaxID=2993563 RepID=A0ABN6WXD8_9BACT|nr:hypothetical protein [Hydrogenimonas cancrithermarum]BDY13708.1 hypothetical protein HCR_20200 [Hydrogenimonas cancrithermarum]
MAKCEELKELLEIEVIPDIEEVIDALFEQIAEAKKADDATKEEYAQLQELRAAFLELLHDLEAADVSEEECAEIFSELEEMIEVSQEDESV